MATRHRLNIATRLRPTRARTPRQRPRQIRVRNYMPRPIRILTFSTLYPSGVRPSHGIFVETRLRHVVETRQVEARVVAPVPWFPFVHQRFGQYAVVAQTPTQEHRNGLDVWHPRYCLLPKIGMTIAPFALAVGARGTAERLLQSGFDFDLIDAHYYYPDGVAAAILGRKLGKPVVITARGSDINQIPQHPIARKMILWAADRAVASIAVCAALKDEMVQLGARDSKIHVLRNGVDLELFRPVDRLPARAKFGMRGFAMASVGHLIPRKGHDLIVAALPMLPDATLHIAGAGPDEASLRALAARLGVTDRVRFLGAMSQQTLRELYCAADCLVLASSHEGWANVLLESMACGTPVVASNVWGTPEIVRSPEAGVLIDMRDPRAIANGVRELRTRDPDRAKTRRYAERFSWTETTDGQLALFKAIRSGEERGERLAHV